MRTTLSISDELLIQAKRRARALGVPLGAVVDAALRRELATPKRADGPSVPTFQGEGGPRPGIDLSSNRSLQEALDEDVPMEKRR